MWGAMRRFSGRHSAASVLFPHTKRRLERGPGAPSLDGYIDAATVGDAHDLVHRIDLREIDDMVRTGWFAPGFRENAIRAASRST